MIDTTEKIINTTDLRSPDDHILSVEEIEQARKAEYVTVPVPEWGGSLRMASVNTEQIETMQKLSKSGNQLEAILEALVQSFVDAEGNPSLTDPEKIKRSAQVLLKKEAKVVERLLKAFATLNGITITTNVSLKV